jgi:hypothetical protein
MSTTEIMSVIIMRIRSPTDEPSDSQTDEGQTEPPTARLIQSTVPAPTERVDIVTAPSEDVEQLEEAVVESIGVPFKRNYETDSHDGKQHYYMRQLVHVFFRLIHDTSIPITISDQDIIDIFNSFDDEQHTNLEQYCDLDSVELNGVKYRKHYSEHEVTLTAKSVPDQSNLIPPIIPTTINFAVESRETLAEVVKRTMHHHPTLSALRHDPINDPTLVKAATQDFMSPMSNERGHVYESGINVAHSGNGGGGGGTSSSSSSSSSS